MYFFLDGMTKAILESGIKYNLSRGLTVFDDSGEQTAAYQDNLRLLDEWNGMNGGRLLADLCIHGEYTSTPKVVEAVAAQAKARGARCACISTCPRRRLSMRNASSGMA